MVIASTGSTSTGSASSGSTSTGFTSSPPAVELRRLFQSFGKTKAVHDVSFEIGRGQVFGYIGPNGAGKTTSMRILATLDLPDFGDALVDGFSVINDPDLVRKRLGFMPDSFGAYHSMNCGEYLDFFARSYGLVGRERIQALRRTLAFTGLDKIGEKPIRGLSKGMRQRLCLGRAMIHDPLVLILDEPANGLDPRARIELRVLIRELAAAGKCVMVSSHILTELGEMCDSIGIIERGRLLITGTVAEIQARLRPHFDIVLEMVREGDRMGAWLSGRTGISQIQATDRIVRFQFQGTQQDQSALLKTIINEGYEVLQFMTETRSLEDVFLEVTTGAVQ